MKHPEYHVHPAVDHAKAIVANLARTTDASIDEWVHRIGETGISEMRPLVAWLRADRGLGGTTAAVVARVALEGYASIDEAAYLAAAPGYVDALYRGPRAALRPIHDALVELCVGLGPDIRLCPATTMLPVYRRHVIAQIRPATRTRIDLGLALGPDASGDRLVDTGGVSEGDRITHRIPLETPRDLDDGVVSQLRKAYSMDAGG